MAIGAAMQWTAQIVEAVMPKRSVPESAFLSIDGSREVLGLIVLCSTLFHKMV